MTVGSICGSTEVDERARPVDRLGDRRRLLELERADRAHDARDLVGERFVDLGDAHAHDVLLALETRVVDVQVEAAALERLRQLAGVVRREDHDRPPRRAHDRAQLGNRHLEVGEHLEQQRLGLDLHPVDLVDEEHDRLLGADRLEQRAGEEERLAEDVGLDVGPARLVLAVDLDPEELLLVVPLVERLGLVEPLVALEPDEPAAGDGGDRLGQLGLADAGGALDQDRLLQAVGEEHHPGDADVRQVVGLAQPRDHVVDTLKSFSHLLRLSALRRPLYCSRATSRDTRLAHALRLLRGRSRPVRRSVPGRFLVPDLAVAPHEVLVGGELAQRHRATRVQLLRGDPDLRAEPELGAVGEARRRVDHHGGGVDLGGEPPRRVELAGEDRFGVPRAEPVHVVDRGVERRHDRHRELEREELGREVVVAGRRPSRASASRAPASPTSSTSSSVSAWHTPWEERVGHGLVHDAATPPRCTRSAGSSSRSPRCRGHGRGRRTRRRRSGSCRRRR